MTLRLDRLPGEILTAIFKHVDEFEDVNNMAAVARGLLAFANTHDEQLYRPSDASVELEGCDIDPGRRIAPTRGAWFNYRLRLRVVGKILSPTRPACLKLMDAIAPAINTIPQEFGPVDTKIVTTSDMRLAEGGSNQHPSRAGELVYKRSKDLLFTKDRVRSGEFVKFGIGKPVKSIDSVVENDQAKPSTSNNTFAIVCGAHPIAFDSSDNTLYAQQTDGKWGKVFEVSDAEGITWQLGASQFDERLVIVLGSGENKWPYVACLDLYTGASKLFALKGWVHVEQVQNTLRPFVAQLPMIGDKTCTQKNNENKALVSRGAWVIDTNLNAVFLSDYYLEAKAALSELDKPVGSIFISLRD